MFNTNITANRIIFFGTSEFAIPALGALANIGYDIVVVITTPDEPAGRKQILTPPPIKVAARKLGLAITQPTKLKGNSELIAYSLKLKVNIGIVAAYGKIIPPELINLPEHGILNIHPSLLPKYRGPSPIQAAILNGERETGVTILKIDEEVDHGPIIAKSPKRKVKSDEKFRELHEDLAKIGANLLIKILPDYLAGKIKPVEQDHSQATFTKIIKKENGRIDWHQEAKQTYNQYRAFHLWPGIFTSVKRKAKSEKQQILKITDCKVSDRQPYHGHDEIYIGKVYQEDDEIYVPCSIGHLDILRVQLESGKEMPIRDFLSGHRDFIGSLLE